MIKNNKLLLIVFLLLILISYLFFKLIGVLWPFIFAFIFAYLLDPLVVRLRKTGLKKEGAVWGIFVIFFLVLTSAGLFLYSTIRTEIPAVQEKIPVYVNSFQEKWIPYLEATFHLRLPKNAQDYIKNITERLLNLSPGVAESVTGFATRAFSKTLDLLLVVIDLLLIPVIIIYFLLDFDKIRHRIPEIVPETYRSGFLRHLREINQILRGFVGGQVLISLILSVLYITGLRWIGLELSVILGLFSGLMNIIPYFGVLAGALISTLFVLFTFHDIPHTLMVLGLYLLGHLLDGYILSPKIVGRKTGLHPLMVILSLLIGGKLFGLLGLLFSVPVMAVANYGLTAGFEYYKKSDFYRAGPDRKGEP